LTLGFVIGEDVNVSGHGTEFLNRR
jgi:hypothetical protein